MSTDLYDNLEDIHWDNPLDATFFDGETQSPIVRRFVNSDAQVLYAYIWGTEEARQQFLSDENFVLGFKVERDKPIEQYESTENSPIENVSVSLEHPEIQLDQEHVWVEFFFNTPPPFSWVIFLDPTTEEIGGTAPVHYYRTEHANFIRPTIKAEEGTLTLSVATQAVTVDSDNDNNVLPEMAGWRIPAEGFVPSQKFLLIIDGHEQKNKYSLWVEGSVVTREYINVVGVQ